LTSNWERGSIGGDASEGIVCNGRGSGWVVCDISLRVGVGQDLEGNLDRVAGHDNRVVEVDYFILCVLEELLNQVPSLRLDATQHNN
jgi:hypothetical protein